MTIARSDARHGYRTGATVNTAVAIATGHLFATESGVSYSENASNEDASVLGLGLGMANEKFRGPDAPTLSFSLKPTYQDGFSAVIADFFGGKSAPTQQTAGQGDYLHRFIYSATRAFGTIAVQDTPTTVIEYPSCYPQSLTIGVPDFPALLLVDAEFLATNRVDGSVVNTTATMGTATRTDDEPIRFTRASKFWINAQGGAALSSGDKRDILNATLQLDRPMRHNNAATGSNAMAAPTNDGLFTGTLTVTFPSRAATREWLAAFAAGSKFKAVLGTTGTQIGTGVNKKCEFYLPSLKIISDPDNNEGTLGIPVETVVFECLAATAAPSGMSSALPYCELINTRATTY